MRGLELSKLHRYQSQGLDDASQLSEWGGYLCRVQTCQNIQTLTPHSPGRPFFLPYLCVRNRKPLECTRADRGPYEHTSSSSFVGRLEPSPFLKSDKSSIHRASKRSSMSGSPSGSCFVIQGQVPRKLGYCCIILRVGTGGWTNYCCILDDHHRMHSSRVRTRGMLPKYSISPTRVEQRAWYCWYKDVLVHVVPR